GLPTGQGPHQRADPTHEAGERGIDGIRYHAHLADRLGAHNNDEKPPSAQREQAEGKMVYESKNIPIATQADRVRHIMQCAFNGRRIVVFSGGATKGEDAVFEDARAIRDGGGNGSIIGRNAFQRPREDALKLLDRIMKIYQGKE
ncbi:fructose-bisphosphate aldolase, partial [Azospirillum brasilense]|nr:fructose-bisphosphate aldolase [Azospirillum brasilense]